VRSSIDYHNPALAPDGRFVATGTEDAIRREQKPNPAIHLWELASGQEVATLELPEHGIGTSDIAYSPDGRFLVACCNPSTRNPGDQTIRIWDVVSGQEVRHFMGHLAPAWSAAFTADCRSIISGSADGTALVWDVSDLAQQPKAEPLAAAALKGRWDELSSPDARVAYRAMWALSVPSAVPFLRDQLSAAPAAAHKGTPVTDGPVGPPEVLRVLRAIAALERVGTPAARVVIETLAQGDPSAYQTKEARSTLARLSNRTN
jgi:WD40 repeat protein